MTHGALLVIAPEAWTSAGMSVAGIAGYGGLPIVPQRMSLGMGRSADRRSIGMARITWVDARVVVASPYGVFNAHQLPVRVIAGMLPRGHDRVVSPQSCSANHATGSIGDLGPRRQDHGLVRIDGV